MIDEPHDEEEQCLDDGRDDHVPDGAQRRLSFQILAPQQVAVGEQGDDER